MKEIEKIFKNLTKEEQEKSLPMMEIYYNNLKEQQKNEINLKTRKISSNLNY